VHGGLPSSPVSLSEISALDRPYDIPAQGWLCDLLWADPRGGAGYGPSYRKSRGIFMFGPDVTEKFCRDNGLKYVIRSHELKQAGWFQDHPQLFTVFSAPNYMDTGGNDGAFFTVANNAGNLTVTPTQYKKTDHPATPPMIWQEYFLEDCPHLTKKMKKKSTGSKVNQQDGQHDEPGKMLDGHIQNLSENNSPMKILIIAAASIVGLSFLAILRYLMNS